MVHLPNPLRSSIQSLLDQSKAVGAWSLAAYRLEVPPTMELHGWHHVLTSKCTMQVQILGEPGWVDHLGRSQLRLFVIFCFLQLAYKKSIYCFVLTRNDSICAPCKGNQIVTLKCHHQWNSTELASRTSSICFVQWTVREQCSAIAHSKIRCFFSHAYYLFKEYCIVTFHCDHIIHHTEKVLEEVCSLKWGHSSKNVWVLVMSGDHHNH